MISSVTSKIVEKGDFLQALNKNMINSLIENAALELASFGVRVNGVFDDLTEKSVYKIQNDYGFDLNGIVGPLLWRKVVELSKR